MGRMATRGDVSVKAVLEKLQAISDVYAYSSFGAITPFLSLAGSRLLSKNILWDVIDRMFGTLPDDTVGMYYLDVDGLMVNLTYTEASMTAIGVDKAVVDAAAGSRVLTERCFVELAKIVEKVEYVAISPVTVRGNAYYMVDESIVDTYDSDNWPSNVSLNTTFFRLVLPSRFYPDFSYQGNYSYSVPSSWSGLSTTSLVLNHEFVTLKPYLSSGLKYYDNLGHSVPDSVGKRHSLVYADNVQVDLGAFFPPPFAWTKTVSPTDLFWTGGWGLESVGIFVAI